MKPNSFFDQTFANQPETYVKAADENHGLINFSSGEVDQPVSRGALTVLRRLKSKDLVEYPDLVCRRLKMVIAKRFGVNQNMVAVGNGSDEIIENIPRVFLEPGESCLFVVPTFFRFIESCRKMKAEIVMVRTREEDGFQFTPTVVGEIEQMLKRHRPKITWIDSPNSVHGGVVPSSVLQKIVSLTNQLIVIDEVHRELIDPTNKHSAIRLLAKHKNLIILKSVSKAFGLAGVRLGFAIAGPEIVAALEKWRLTFAVNSVAQELAKPAILDREHVNLVAKSVKRQREKVFKSIKLMPDFIIGAASKTHLFILKHKLVDVFEALKHQGVLAADFRQAAGLEGLGFVRLNVKTPTKSRLLLKALAEIYNSNVITSDRRERGNLSGSSQ